MTDRPITKEIIEIYISTLEKQVQQATLIVRTLEELNDKLKDVDGLLRDGFKDNIKEHITGEIEALTDKLEKALTTLYITKGHAEEIISYNKDMPDRARDLTDEVKDKISGLHSHMIGIRSDMKVDRAVNIIGWSAFILSMLTIVLKLFGRL